MILVILFFGLRPKSISSNNDVQLLPDEHALSFRKSSIAYADDLKIFHSSNDSNEFTIKLRIAVQNIEENGFRPVLMIHDGVDHDQLTIWQWGASLIAMNGDDYNYTKKAPRVSTKDILTPGKIVDISLTSSSCSTKLYIDGRLLAEHQAWQISIPDNGRKKRLILGNSAYAKHGWEGSIYSLAIYTRALSAQEVRRQYLWQSPNTPLHNNPPENVQLHYTFTERNGTSVNDQYGLQIPLLLPERRVMLKKNFLSMPWHGFSVNSSFLVDVLLNLFGFIPLGALLYWRILQSYTGSERSTRTITFLSCFLISFFIETFQAWQPARHSSLQDLLLNSFSGYLGILLASIYFKRKRDRTICVDQK